MTGLQSSKTSSASGSSVSFNEGTFFHVLGRERQTEKSVYSVILKICSSDGDFPCKIISFLKGHFAWNLTNQKSKELKGKGCMIYYQKWNSYC